MNTQGFTLLTGGTGFLGSNLAKALSRQGVPLILLKRSTSRLTRLQGWTDRFLFYDLDKTPLATLFEKHSIDQIIHCATNYGRKKPPPLEIVEANLSLPLSLLHLAKKKGVQSFINTDTILDMRVNAYSLSKKQFLDWLKMLSDEIVAINVSVEHFFGPMDDPSKFVTSVIQDLLKNVPSMDFTPGRQQRDFIFIDDVIEAFLKIIHFSKSTPQGFYHFEVGRGESIEIQQFVKLTKGLCHNQVTQLNFGAIPYRENETLHSKVDLEPLKRLGWAPKINLIEGLEKTIQEENKIIEAGTHG